MNEPSTFRTKTGVCQVWPDRLVLGRQGVRGQLAAVQGRSKGRVLFVYGIAVVCLGWLGVSDLLEGRTGSGVFSLALMAWVVVMLSRSRGFSVASEVTRADTTRVEPIRGWTGLTRDRLVVHFREDGRPARRFILLPGVFQGGPGELDRAVAAFREAGWPVG